MRLKAFRRIGDPQPIIAEDLSFIIIEDDATGTPLVVAVAVAHGPRTTEVVTAKDPNFNRVLSLLGINQLVICENANDLLKPVDQLPVVFSNRGR